MDESDTRSMILHYGREKLYHTMHTCAVEAVTRFQHEPTFRLLNGIALVLGNRVQEAIRELTPMQNDREINLPTILALIYAHKRCTVVDKEAILALDQKMKEERKRVTPVAVYYAAVFLFLSGKSEKASEYSDKALKMNSALKESCVLKGWIELSTGQRIDQSVFELFENSTSLDAHLGRIRFHQLNNDFENAIALLNKLAVRYVDHKLPLVERMKTELANWRWDTAKETALRILNLDPTNIEAHQVMTLIACCYEGNIQSSITGLEHLFAAVRKVEPANAELFLQIGQLFGRLAFANRSLLAQSFLFVEKASQLAPTNVRVLTELGIQSVSLGNFKEAVKYFKQATKVDDSATEALCGLTLCQLSESGPSEQVAQQIEFLAELQSGTKIPLLLLMSARMTDEADQKISLLIESSEWHIKNLRRLSFGPEYLRLFNPTFLLDLATDLLRLCPISSIKPGSTGSLHKSLAHTLNILEMTVKVCPGRVEAVNLLAKVQVLCGDPMAALYTLQHILQDVEPKNTDANLLIAQIHVQQNQFLKAKQSLEICLGHNFRVRDSAMYHLLNGMVQQSSQQYDEAINSFGQAMQLAGLVAALKELQITTTGVAPHKSTGNTPPLGLSDQITLYLEMANALTAVERHSDTSRLMEEALARFAKTPEEGRLLIANADLLLRQGKVDLSLGVLGNIPYGEPYYIPAKTKMAQIFLLKKKDRLSFAQCFRELVDNCPVAESHIMLGDAYMSIQEPDRALEAYKAALKLQPWDENIARKLGSAYVKTHQFAKAISFFKEVTGSKEHVALKMDLAELYLKLKQYRNAEEILIASISENSSDTNDLDVLQMRTKQLLLLARVRERSGNLTDSLKTLVEARNNQARINKRMTIAQSVPEQQGILSRISSLLAEQSMSVRDNNSAEQYYKEAIKYAPKDTCLLASLARLYMQMNAMDACQHVCDQILQIDSQNEAASVMMADLSFRKMDFESAGFHFSQLLSAQPTYWTALARLIEVTRRAGTIATVVPDFIRRGEQNCKQPVAYEAGLNYCKGLYELYTGNPNSALRLFNNARRDAEWGKQAVFKMIEICINPDGDLPNESQLEGQIEDVRDSHIVAIDTAKRLVKELQPRQAGSMDSESLNYKLMENFIPLASRQRYLVEQALQSLMAIAAQDEYRDHVGPIYGMAVAHVLLKQTQRAKNQLKRVAKHLWTFEDAEHLERCWLLLADLYVHAGKLDIASELLVRVLDHNKSCVKAHELCGLISEKEALPKAAVVHYDLAWRFSGKSKSSIGYRLAYNYMKAKRFPDAIDICQQVLKLNPEFMAIKKDILDKCRNNLKL